MGTISTGPLASLTMKLARKYGIDSFVETGTFHGDAARFAATLFARVVTIEIKREYQEQAILQSPGTHIEFLLGDSASLLPDVVAGLNGPALFWLDGHAGAGFYADEDNCPLLAELRAIGTSPHPHVILSTTRGLSLHRAPRRSNSRPGRRCAKSSMPRLAASRITAL